MDYTRVAYTTPLLDTIKELEGPGLLLVTSDAAGKPNAMTIGWATVGTIWGRPIFTVLVRESRYTYGLINAAGSFTVCVPTANMREAVGYCGKHSGRDHDKFQECGFVALASDHVSAPGIDGCRAIYECRTLHAHDLSAENLAADVVNASYRSGDFHRVYIGEILAVKVAAGS